MPPVDAVRVPRRRVVRPQADASLLYVDPRTDTAYLVHPSGTTQALGSGSGGSSDHADLTHLAYADAGHTGFVPSTRAVTAGAGLVGGGDLTADRAFSLDASGVTPASKGSATRAVVVTVDVYGRSTALSDVLITPAISDTTGTLAVARGGTGQTTTAAAFNALSPLTTDEDIIIRRGSTNIRLAAPAAGDRNNRVLGFTADAIAWIPILVVGVLGRGDVWMEGRSLLDVPSCTSTDKP